MLIFYALDAYTYFSLANKLYHLLVCSGVQIQLYNGCDYCLGGVVIKQKYCSNLKA